MTESIKHRKRTDTMLRMAIAKNTDSNIPVIYTEKTAWFGTRKKYIYPLDEMRCLIDTIVIPVSSNPQHEYGRQKVRIRVRTQAQRKGIKVSISYCEIRNAIIVTRTK